METLTGDHPEEQEFARQLAIARNPWLANSDNEAVIFDNIAYPWLRQTLRVSEERVVKRIKTWPATNTYISSFYYDISDIIGLPRDVISSVLSQVAELGIVKVKPAENRSGIYFFERDDLRAALAICITYAEYFEPDKPINLTCMEVETLNRIGSHPLASRLRAYNSSDAKNPEV